MIIIIFMIKAHPFNLTTFTLDFHCYKENFCLTHHLWHQLLECSLHQWSPKMLPELPTCGCKAQWVMTLYASWGLGWQLVAPNHHPISWWWLGSKQVPSELSNDVYDFIILPTGKGFAIFYVFLYYNVI